MEDNLKNRIDDLRNKVYEWQGKNDDAAMIENSELIVAVLNHLEGDTDPVSFLSGEGFTF